MIIVRQRLRPGCFLSFEYDTPKKNGRFRKGELLRIYRAKKNNLLHYVIMDESAKGEARQFRYQGMRNIKVKNRRS
jgi:hypothetical protein